MPINFYCPLGHRLAVPDDRAGKRGRCPVCQQKVYVPVANPLPSGKPKSRPGDIVATLPPSVGPASGPRTSFESTMLNELGIGTELPPPSAPIPEAEKPAATHPLSSTEPEPIPRWVNMPSKRSSRPHDQPPTKFERVQPEEVRSAWQPPSRGTLWAVVPGGVDIASYRADAAQTLTGHLLSTLLVLIAGLGMSPGVSHAADAAAPAWAQVVLVVGALQLVYALWFASLPDYSTLWVGMLVCVASAALYGCGMAMILSAPRGGSLPLGLFDVRHAAGGWCAANMFLLAGLAYAFGYFSYAWRRGK